MRTPYMTFGIDSTGSSLLYTLMLQWPHKNKPGGIPLHLPLFKLDARGMDYTCRMLGEIVFDKLKLCHPGAVDGLDLFLPAAVGDQRFVAEDDTVIHLAANGTLRDLHVATGLADSALQLVIVQRDKNENTEIGRSIALMELAALGAETASMSVGDIVLRKLIQQHKDVFAKYPHLAVHPQDRP